MASLERNGSDHNLGRGMANVNSTNIIHSSRRKVDTEHAAAPQPDIPQEVQTLMLMLNDAHSTFRTQINMPKDFFSKAAKDVPEHLRRVCRSNDVSDDM
jgi:hypothetical protein